jgi:hypothetical protein
MRYRVVEELVELASPAQEQIDHLRPYYEELLKGYLNWSYEMLPVLNEQGALSPDVVRTTDAVSAALWSLDAECAAEYESTGAITAFTEEGIRSDPRWEAIRGLASEALTAFRELGIPTPKLSDEDFNRPREDAP